MRPNTLNCLKTCVLSESLSKRLKFGVQRPSDFGFLGLLFSYLLLSLLSLYSCNWNCGKTWKSWECFVNILQATTAALGLNFVVMGQEHEYSGLAHWKSGPLLLMLLGQVRRSKCSSATEEWLQRRHQHVIWPQAGLIIAAHARASFCPRIMPISQLSLLFCNFKGPVRVYTSQLVFCRGCSWNWHDDVNWLCHLFRWTKWPNKSKKEKKLEKLLKNKRAKNTILVRSVVVVFLFNIWRLETEDANAGQWLAAQTGL